MFDMLEWFISHLAAPVKLIKAMILTWLCLRAFDHNSVAQFENSLISQAKHVWDSWDFEQVELRGDFTGWKHLMAKINHGAANIIHDGRPDVFAPRDMALGELDEGAEDAPMVDEASAEAINEGKQSAFAKEEEAAGPPSSVPRVQEAEKEDGLTILDRIDLALGWKPPRETV